MGMKRDRRPVDDAARPGADAPTYHRAFDESRR
jgi:hypothetical protein